MCGGKEAKSHAPIDEKLHDLLQQSLNKDSFNLNPIAKFSWFFIFGDIRKKDGGLFVLDEFKIINNMTFYEWSMNYYF